MAVELVAGQKGKRESRKAVIACNDYLRMGPGRSLTALLRRWSETNQNQPPTLHLATLKEWSATYAWQDRAETYDATIEADKQAAEKERQRQIAERRKSVMEDGAALDFERVAKLKRLADLLEAQVFYEAPSGDVPIPPVEVLDESGASVGSGDIVRTDMPKLDPNDPKAKHPNIWARDVRGLAGGRIANIVRFNGGLLAELRATLDDIAKETGGRRQRTLTENIDYNKLTEDQLARVAAGEDPIQVILSDYVPGDQG